MGKEGAKGSNEDLCICLPMYTLVHEYAHVLLAGTQLWPKLWS